MSAVVGDEKRLRVLKGLLARLRALDIYVRRLYLDRGFTSVAIIRLKQQPFVFILPPKRGKRLKALLNRKSYRTAYTIVSMAMSLVVFFPLQRYFVRGILAGSVNRIHPER